MMSDGTTTGYNGWTNYETWCWKLWIDNEEPSYRYACQIADETLARADDAGMVDIHTSAALYIADRLKSEAEEIMPEMVGVWFDLLRAALSEINWYEIAESLLEDAQERVA